MRYESKARYSVQKYLSSKVVPRYLDRKVLRVGRVELLDIGAPPESFIVGLLVLPLHYNDKKGYFY